MHEYYHKMKKKNLFETVRESNREIVKIAMPLTHISMVYKKYPI